MAMEALRALTGTRSPSQSRSREAESPDFHEWLHSGRLRLVDESQQVIPAERWASLPIEVRDQTLEDFQRVVRSRAKAAVLFVRA